MKTVLFYLYERTWAGIAWGTSPAAAAEEELVAAVGGTCKFEYVLSLYSSPLVSCFTSI